MNRERRRRGLLLGALALPLVVGCGDKIQQEYDLQIISPPGEYFHGAATAVMSVAGKEIGRTSVSEGAPFSFTSGGIDTGSTAAGAISVSVLDGAGKVIGYGETPTIELQLVNYPLVVYIQRPGTFGPSATLSPARSNMVAVAAPAAPDVGLTGTTVTVPVIGLGMVKPGTNAPATLGDSIYFYNPFEHSLDSQDIAGTPNGMRQYRRDSAGLVGKDGNVYFFGGLASTDPMSTQPTPSSELDTVRAIRSVFPTFRQASLDSKASPLPEVARSSAVLAESDAIYAFGGQNGTAELDTVVALHPGTGDPANIFELLNIRMGAPRVGHTATPVSFGTIPDILLFGGDQSAPAVAELLVPANGKPAFMRPTGDPGVTRWNHAALPLANDRVLLVGGMGPSGVLGSSVLYEGHDRRLSPGAINLKTPRADFAAFVVGTELVVAGGIGADGKPVGNAEIYDASSDALAFRGTTPCEARYHAGVTVMGNQSALIIGGLQLDDHGVLTQSSTVEVYQPTR
jgi:hypothetical protein